MSGTPTGGVFKKLDLVNPVEKYSRGRGVFWKMMGLFVQVRE